MNVLSRIRVLLLHRRRRPSIELVKGDITTQQVDVVVNAAKSSLLGGGGVDGAIHRAGGPEIIRQCQAIRSAVYPDGLPVGEVVPTTAGRMPAKHVIHTVGPRWGAPGGNDEVGLRSCYTSSLAMADLLGAESVAFPLISSGVYGWPVEDAIVQALRAIASTRLRYVRTVRLMVFDDRTYGLAQSIYDRGAY